jgi:hypothetical protein
MLPKARGELVGAYQVEGELTDNSCGKQALPAPAHLSFHVELRNDKGEGLWVRDAPPPFSGSLDDKGYFSFDTSNSYMVAGNNVQEPADQIIQAAPEQLTDPELFDRLDQQANKNCGLAVDQSVHGRVLRDVTGTTDGADTSSGDDLTADNDIEIRSTSGSDCSRVLAAQGGPFDQLPCKAHYALTGELSNK